MATLHPSLAAQIRRQIEVRFPYAACDACLAALVLATPEETRQAALVVAREEGFMRRLRVCSVCRRGVELTARE
jgi:hypothetical protein